MFFPYKKILIIGCGGAGKSTLAVKMSKRFGLPVIHLDKLWWLPGWIARSADGFDALLREELKKPQWIIDGNYKRTFAERLNYADLCIFLDCPTDLCIKSVYERAERNKGISRPDITEGCIEYIDDEFKQFIQTYKTSVRPEMLKILKHSRVPSVVFENRDDADKYISGFDQITNV